MVMSSLERFPGTAWPPTLDEAGQARALEALEAGGILLFPDLRFAIEPSEGRFFVEGWSAAAKNISYEAARRSLGGTKAEGEDATGLTRLMARYAEASRRLVEAAIPLYRGRIETARTSFRPVEIAGRSSSPRQDDTRLHVDAFPSRPTAGRRILRARRGAGASAAPSHRPHRNSTHACRSRGPAAPCSMPGSVSPRADGATMTTTCCSFMTR
jgi:hypothetical protein